MKHSTKFYTVVTIAVGLILGAVAKDTFINQSSAQTLAPSPMAIGRYQFVSSAKGTAYIFDTATGRCWVQVGPGINSKEWEQIGPDAAIQFGQPGNLGQPGGFDHHGGSGR